MIHRERLHNKIVREIITAISSGQYGDGERLPGERKLCEQFSVSRGSVRQALADLDKMGIIQIRKGSGAYVRKLPGAKIPHHYLPPDFDRTSLDDIIVARKAIELAAVRIVAECIAPADFNRLTALAEAMEQSIEHLPDFLRHDMQFHQTLVRASRNIVLTTALEAIYEYQRYFMIFTSGYEGEQREALEYHWKLLRAIEHQNAAMCVKILSDHLDHYRKYTAKGKIRFSSGIGKEIAL
jgi:DNA-binding FadR family transcriptional regulator